MVDCLEYPEVQVASVVAFKRNTHHGIGIGETLDTDADGSMAKIGRTSFGNGVIVDIDDFIQILGDNFDDFVQLFKVKARCLCPIARVRYKTWQTYARQIAYGDLIRGGIFDDF